MSIDQRPLFSRPSLIRTRTIDLAQNTKCVKLVTPHMTGSSKECLFPPVIECLRIDTLGVHDDQQDASNP